LEGIHFFFDDVGVLSHAAGEKLGILKDRGINTLIAVKLTEFNHLLLYKAPVWLLFR
jgi:hypothetical protein